MTTHHAASELADRGFTETYPLDTCETFAVGTGDAALDVTATPGRHGPPVVAEALPEGTGSVRSSRPTARGAARSGAGRAGREPPTPRLGRHPPVRRGGGGARALPRHRPRTPPPRRDAGAGRTVDDARRPGGRRRTAVRRRHLEPGPLRRLRRVRVTAVRLRGDRLGGGPRRPSRVPRPGGDGRVRRAVPAAGGPVGSAGDDPPIPDGIVRRHAREPVLRRVGVGAALASPVRTRHRVRRASVASPPPPRRAGCPPPGRV